VELTKVLLHLVDATGEDVAEDYRTVRRELKAYGGGLDKKKEIVALSKCDALDAATIAEKSEALKKACRKKPLVLSAVSGQGVKDALYALAREIGRAGDKEEESEPAPRQPWRP
jgi:GTP-binding protein